MSGSTSTFSFKLPSHDREKVKCDCSQRISHIFIVELLALLKKWNYLELFSKQGQPQAEAGFIEQEVGCKLGIV